MRKKLKYKGISFEIRSINELDLLGFDSYIPIFEIDREHETNWVNKSIDEQNERLKKEEKYNTELFCDHIINRCVLSCKLSITRRILLYLIRYKNNVLAECKKDKAWNTVLLNEIFKISTNIEKHKIKQSTAESIYYIYKGMNFADEYFKDEELNAIEKYAFNRVIYNTGVNADNRRAKNG